MIKLVLNNNHFYKCFKTLLKMILKESVFSLTGFEPVT